MTERQETSVKKKKKTTVISICSAKLLPILWVSAYISRKMHAKVCAEETAL